MALSKEEREAFLAEPLTAVLGVAAGPERGPLLVPLWYFYEPGGRPWILTGRDSRKAGLIAETGRFSLLVQRLTPTVRYVSVEGPVEESAPATAERVREIAGRYLSGEALEQYLASPVAMEESVVIRMRPERWTSSDLGAW
ncbi:pyridoxamine 5'-phosphate oxidase family protein [Streptomyces sp. NPDC047130]|uniref:pyridoxamine 5'-phosphate oxidase family protein n=1 Tax=Streptomyces sp. NPDC047130 TaxID=3155261 RepID=UPI00340A2433